MQAVDEKNKDSVDSVFHKGNIYYSCFKIRLFILSNQLSSIKLLLFS